MTTATRYLADAARPLWRGILGHSTGRWLVLAGVVGALCGIAGFVLNLGVNALSTLLLGQLIGSHPHLVGPLIPGALEQPLRPWLILPVLALGGALSGWLATRFAEDAAGGGLGVAVQSFHERRGVIALRTTLTKLVASVVTIGSGGSTGREGPIALVGAGLGSWVAMRLGLTVRDRRVLLAAGIAGGTAAVFHVPLAAAILAAEILYRTPELESEVLIPSFIASIVGFTVCGLAEGAWNASMGVASPLTASIFTAPAGIGFDVSQWRQLGGYGLVVIALVIAARLFIAILAMIQTRMEAWIAQRWLRAGCGALLSGGIVIALLNGFALLGAHEDAALSIMGPGYDIVQTTLNMTTAPWTWAVVLAIFAFAKILATALIAGSGCSAGIFGSTIAVGGCVGGAVGIALQGTVFGPPIPACVLIGMAGMLGASLRTPVAALLMVSEIGGTYALLIPAMWVVGPTFLLLGDRSLIAGQAHSPADSPAHHGKFFKDLFAGSTVAELLDRSAQVTSLAPSSTLDDCRRALAETKQTVFPVIEHGLLTGIVTLDDLRGFVYQRDTDALVRVADLASGVAAALHPEDSLGRALRRFNQHRLDDLPVTNVDGTFIGLLNREALFEHYQRSAEQLTEDRHREGYIETTDWRRATGSS
jgi:CIC family chloride channel protein